MKLAVLIILVNLLTGCVRHVGSSEAFHDVSHTFGLNSHEYAKSYTPSVEYPKKNCDTGFEGYVLVEYSINEKGNVMNVAVIDTDANGVLDQYAIDAVTKFKYVPRKVDGATIKVDGVKSRLSFCCDKCRDNEKFEYANRSQSCDRLHSNKASNPTL